ncbi:hypothetical protein ACROYT_G014239 [Oculina patagonica]
MEPLQITLDSTRKTLAVIFVKEKSISLSDVRVQITEEVKELVPESFKFVSTFGAPISEVQEAKISLIHALHEETFLVVREFKNAPKMSLKRTADKSAEDDEDCQLLDVSKEEEFDFDDEHLCVEIFDEIDAVAQAFLDSNVAQAVEDVIDLESLLSQITDVGIPQNS